MSTSISPEVVVGDACTIMCTLSSGRLDSHTEVSMIAHPFFPIPAGARGPLDALWEAVQ